MKKVESAIPLSLVKPKIRNWNKNRYGSIFNKYGSGNGPEKYRIYVPMGEQIEAESVVPEEIQTALSKKGYTVESYKAGLAVDSTGKRKMRIGKLLSDNPALLKQFTNDAGRAAKSGNLLMVISRHPYDVLGMSFDRGWTSCMNLTEGCHKSFLNADVKYGTVVAYLVKSDDKNINRPIARIALRPAFKSGKLQDSMILCAGPMYGQGNPAFNINVEKFTEWANSGSPKGVYKMPGALYTDDYAEEYDSRGNLIIRYGLSNEDILKLPIGSQLSLAQNSSSINVIRLLSKSDDEDILRCIAQNSSTPTDVLDSIIRDPDSEDSSLVSILVARNPNTTAGTLKKLSTYVADTVRASVASHPRTDGMTLFAMVQSEEDPYVLQKLINNRNTPAVAFETLSSSRWARGTLGGLLASRTDISPTALDNIAKQKNPNAQLTVAHNPSTSNETLEYLTEASNDDVRTAAREILESRQ